MAAMKAKIFSFMMHGGDNKVKERQIDTYDTRRYETIRALSTIVYYLFLLFSFAKQFLKDRHFHFPFAVLSGIQAMENGIK